MDTQIKVVRLSQLYKSRDEVDAALAMGGPVLVMHRDQIVYELYEAKMRFENVAKPSVKTSDASAQNGKKSPQSSVKTPVKRTLYADTNGVKFELYSDFAVTLDKKVGHINKDTDLFEPLSSSDFYDLQLNATTIPLNGSTFFIDALADLRERMGWKLLKA